MGTLSDINELINKKFKGLQNEIKDFNQMFLGLKAGFATQIGETRKAIEQLGGLISTVAKAVDKKLEFMEHKPCMKIKTIFTDKQIKKLLELIK